MARMLIREEGMLCGEVPPTPTPALLLCELTP